MKEARLYLYYITYMLKHQCLEDTFMIRLNSDDAIGTKHT